MNTIDNKGGDGKGGKGGNRKQICSFCNRSGDDAGPVVEGPRNNDTGESVYICANCVDLCHNIIRQEKRKLTAAQPLFSDDSHAAADQGIPRSIRHRPGLRQDARCRWRCTITTSG